MRLVQVQYTKSAVVTSILYSQHLRSMHTHITVFYLAASAFALPSSRTARASEIATQRSCSIPRHLLGADAATELVAIYRRRRVIVCFPYCTTWRRHGPLDRRARRLRPHVSRRRIVRSIQTSFEIIARTFWCRCQ